MPRHCVAFVSCAALAVALASRASAQTPTSSRVLVGQQAAAREGRVRGSVSDEAGRAIAGVNIVALGGRALPVTAKTDAAGQFMLQLAPGEYILRATREGYVSTYREPVRIQSSTELKRKIVLIRQAAPPARVVIKAGTDLEPLVEDAEDTAPASEVVDPDHAHTEAAWRLRHLSPTALRDIADTYDFDGGENVRSFRPGPSFVDWMMGESARAAASFFSNTNFTGQVNFLTSSALAGAEGWLPAQLPHGIAYIAVGAPVGSVGDWSVRGAMTASALASWVVLGEYTARDDRPHAFSAGVSYGSQPIASGSDLAPVAVNDRVRSVGGVYAYDRWHVQPALELDYGLRLDRYDYVADSEVLSPRLGFKLNVLPRTRVTMQASQYVTAPGADEFLPPASAGPWLPPERTFAPLTMAGTLQAERVRNYAVGVEEQLGRADDAPVVGIRRFREVTQDQVATLFGLDEQSQFGHYYVATAGAIDADGWVLHVSGRLLPRVAGSVQYMTSRANWTPGSDAMQMAVLLPSVVRAGRERLHDVTTSLTASIPETSTKVLVAYRLDSAFSSGSSTTLMPVLGGRFQLELRQALPLQPMRGAHTELVFAVRNLFRDPANGASMYDELLTVAPPMRVMGGVQVKF